MYAGGASLLFMMRGVVVDCGRRVGGAACFVGGDGGEDGSSDGENGFVQVVDGDVGEKLPLRVDLRRKSLSLSEVPRENMVPEFEDTGEMVERGEQEFEG